MNKGTSKVKFELFQIDSLGRSAPDSLLFTAPSYHPFHPSTAVVEARRQTFPGPCARDLILDLDFDGEARRNKNRRRRIQNFPLPRAVCTSW